jgi:hypothetical protein
LVVVLVYRLGWLKSIGFSAQKETSHSVSVENPRKSYNVLRTKSYSFVFPKKWQPVSKESIKQVGGGVVFGLLRSKPKATFALRIIKAKQPIKINFSKLPKTLDKKMAQELPHFKRLKSEKSKVSNLPALRYTYTFSSSSGGTAKQQQVIFSSGKRLFYLIFNAKKSSFDSLQKDFDTITESFKVKS